MTDYRIALLGAICGDIIGSTREFNPTKRLDFELLPEGSCFTDDTVMTCAVAEWLMSPDTDLAETLQRWGHKYNYVGYGPMFCNWLASVNPQPYNSFGNGSAMRVSAAGWVANSVEEALELAKATAAVTHNHIEGVKGAQAVAAAIYLARTGASKEEIAMFISRNFKRYDILRDSYLVRETYRFNATCQGSVPESIIAFIESENYESAVRIAVSLGGDADTMGAIAGSIASAFYKEIPDSIADKCLSLLPSEIIAVVNNFGSLLNS